MIFYNCGEALVDPLSSNLAQDFGHRLFTKKAFIYPWTLSILKSKLFSESVNVNFLEPTMFTDIYRSIFSSQVAFIFGEYR